MKSFGTENRAGHSTNAQPVGTTLPIMQFANSDIEDLKIVEEEQTPTTSKQPSYSMPVVSPPSASRHRLNSHLFMMIQLLYQRLLAQLIRIVHRMVHYLVD